jgi:polyhydroxyalkanoate synthesis regulator phasin
MANPTLKKEEEDRNTLDTQEGCLASQNSSNEDILNSIQSLEVDEARLTEQKEQLTALLNQLEIKAKEEVEKRKRKVKRLNSEVSDLKRRCEKFTRWINSESVLECSQAGF